MKKVSKLSAEYVDNDLYVLSAEEITILETYANFKDKLSYVSVNRSKRCWGYLNDGAVVELYYKDK